VVNATPRPLYPGEKDPVPIVHESGWAPGPVWTGAENLAPTGIRSPERPARSGSLYRLNYTDPSLLSDTPSNFIQCRRFTDSYLPQNDNALWLNAEVIIASFSRNCAKSLVSETHATFIKVAGSSETLVFNYQANFKSQFIEQRGFVYVINRIQLE